MWTKNYDGYGCTYVLYSTRDFLIRYAGATKNTTRERLYHHLYDTRSKYQKQKNKWIERELSDGYEIRIKTISCANDKCELDELERSLISSLKKRGAPLFNIYDGGVGGFHVPENQKELYRKMYSGKKMPEAQYRALMEYHRNNPSPLIGIKRSEETRKKVSIAKTGVPSKKRLPINMFSLDMVFIARFDSLTSAAKTLGVGLSAIANCLTGRSKTCNNRIFKYATNED